MSLDASGNIVGRQAHLPFGEDFAESGTQQKHHLTSYERDSESGLDYAVNRNYGSNVGRFGQLDPVVSNIADPQSLNRYAYTRNDPINLVDPDGRVLAVPFINFSPDLISSQEADDTFPRALTERLTMGACIYKDFFESTLWCCMLIIVFVLCACNGSTNDSSSLPKPANQQSNENDSAGGLSKSNDPLLTEYRDVMPQELKAGWQLFTSNGQYRVARPEDFRFPDDAKKVIEQLGTRTKFPYLRIGFDINLDGDFNDFAAIIVDDTRSDEGRFGLVIFNPPKNKTGPFEPHWVYHNRDLSRSVLTTASSRLVVETYVDNGSEHVCFVIWDARKNRYICKG